MAPTVSPAVLRTVPLFSSFPEEQLRTLATVVSRRSASRGSIVIAAGDPTDSLYIILSGRLKVMMSDAEGKEVILSILSGGEFFGEMGLIDDAPRSASVVAIEPCELLVITRRDFKRCMAENAQAVLGKPDFVFPKKKIALFVDGCFWHQCPRHSNMPKNNREFWEKKLKANKDRDKFVNKELRKLGWIVIRVWEHEMRSPENVAQKILKLMPAK